LLGIFTIIAQLIYYCTRKIIWRSYRLIFRPYGQYHLLYL